MQEWIRERGISSPERLQTLLSADFFGLICTGTSLFIYLFPARSTYSHIGCQSWWVGECSPDIVGVGEVKYPGKIKVVSALLQEDIDLSKARGRKPRSQISSRFGGEALGQQSITRKNI